MAIIEHNQDFKELQNMLDTEQIIPESGLGDFSKQFVVLGKWYVDDFKEEFRTPQNQIFYVTGGYGAEPGKSGDAVYGFFASDGEEARVRRGDVQGILLPELVQKYGLKYVSSPE